MLDDNKITSDYFKFMENCKNEPSRRLLGLIANYICS